LTCATGEKERKDLRKLRQEGAALNYSKPGKRKEVLLRSEAILSGTNLGDAGSAQTQFTASGQHAAEDEHSFALN